MIRREKFFLLCLLKTQKDKLADVDVKKLPIFSFSFT
jgi:hypothetical protein